MISPFDLSPLWSGLRPSRRRDKSKTPRSANPGRNPLKIRGELSKQPGPALSILDFKHHKELWPYVDFIGEIEMRSVTLPAALASNNIDVSLYDALVTDTQGSELLILQGAEDLLERFSFIKTEAADFESYANCATVDSLCRFAAKKGFRLVRQDKFAELPSLGAYYDLLFARL